MLAYSIDDLQFLSTAFSPDRIAYPGMMRKILPYEERPLTTFLKIDYDSLLTWGCSSVGRALASHARGQGFESPHLHQIKTSKKG
jgi:hypothetical protein